MTLALTQTLTHDSTTKKAGSLRERRPGVWEIRVVVGTDAVTRRSVQQSMTFHGNRASAKQRCADLVALTAAERSPRRTDPRMTVAALLDTWIAAAHDWRPSTLVGYKSTAAGLRTGNLGRRPVNRLTPATSVRRWSSGDVTARGTLLWPVGCVRCGQLWAGPQPTVSRRRPASLHVPRATPRTWLSTPGLLDVVAVLNERRSGRRRVSRPVWILGWRSV
jgi:hypothetical protein